MLQALYDALYVHRTAFVWVYFTQHGLVRGRLSKN
jgi:hypothetical protein